ncbi:hypothetical protein SAMN06269185_1519 [Natronoarchaeum philippinense]|uniref:DUF1648 domain-containing protein n=1 Tax=Natronoarchaeum philippinense TaxID=558529 RepID=A0A285NRN3_NATPI|nr:hypothetical protein [Natronoarchaeum philippinense]SNZ12145.1 hypothetical protein SAMN06269185_1519 [Natronoarchaeum philippinense]
MPITVTSNGDAAEPILDRLARAYRPLQATAVVLTAFTVAVGVWAAATLSDPMTIHWTIGADGSLVADRTAGPVVGALLIPGFSAATLLVCVVAARLVRDRAAGALAYGVAALTALALFGSELLLVGSNLI